MLKKEAIAEQVGITRPTVIEWTKNFVENCGSQESTKFEFRDTDFTPPLYNVWTATKRSNPLSYGRKPLE